MRYAIVSADYAVKVLNLQSQMIQKQLEKERKADRLSYKSSRKSIMRSRMRHRMDHIERTDGRVYYRIEGRGHEETLVLLHGLSADSGMFRTF